MFFNIALSSRVLFSGTTPIYLLVIVEEFLLSGKHCESLKEPSANEFEKHLFGIWKI